MPALADFIRQGLEVGADGRGRNLRLRKTTQLAGGVGRLPGTYGRIQDTVKGYRGRRGRQSSPSWEPERVSAEGLQQPVLEHHQQDGASQHPLKVRGPASRHQGRGRWARSRDYRYQAEQAQRQEAYGKHHPRVDNLSLDGEQRFPQRPHLLLCPPAFQPSTRQSAGLAWLRGRQLVRQIRRSRSRRFMQPKRQLQQPRRQALGGLTTSGKRAVLSPSYPPPQCPQVAFLSAAAVMGSAPTRMNPVVRAVAGVARQPRAATDHGQGLHASCGERLCGAPAPGPGRALIMMWASGKARSHFDHPLHSSIAWLEAAQWWPRCFEYCWASQGHWGLARPHPVGRLGQSL